MKVFNTNDIAIAEALESIKLKFGTILADAKKYKWSRAEITSAVSCSLFNCAALGMIKRSAIIDVYKDSILAKIYFAKAIRLVSCTRPLKENDEG